MKILNKANVFWGAVATIGTALFGKYWFLFFGFLVLNIIDYFTGLVKAKFFLKNVSSLRGAQGILKKVMYWLVIGIAFYISACFTEMGEMLGINLSFVIIFGWFTLATYMINEIRSIFENLVAMGIHIPPFLIKGLDITEKMIQTKTEDNSIIE